MRLEHMDEALRDGLYDRNMGLSIYSESAAALPSFQPLRADETNENPIQVLDFFSGAGGMSLGFQLVNTLGDVFHFLGGCDIDRYSSESYAKNFGTKQMCVDILQIAENRDNTLAFLKEIGYDGTKPAIFIGCAPCQGFTSHRKRHWDEDDDERNHLATAFARIVKIAQPTALVMENVPEFLSNKYRSYYLSCLEILEDAGYNVKKSIYNAASFGVPQERYRSILVGLKREFCLPEEFFDHDDYRTVRNAIADLPAIAAGESTSDPLHRAINHKASTIETIRLVPHDGGHLPAGAGPDCRRRTKGFADVYGRLAWDKPSITITHYARNPASGRFVHPEQDRGLTAREAARLQSFPDGFVFSGKSDDVYRQIGEAVPPLFACGIASQVLAELIAKQPTEDELIESRPSIEEPVSDSYSSVIAGMKMRRR